MEALTRTRRRPRLLLLALLAFPSAVFAHRLDEYLQATLVAIEPRDIRLQINLTPGVAVAGQILALIDRDRDGVISTKEAKAYAELLKRDLVVKLDQRHVELRLTASNFPAPAELRAGVGIIRLDFSATSGPITAGVHELTLENRHLPTVSVYLINAALPRSGSVEVTKQKRNVDQSVGEIEFTLHPQTRSSIEDSIARRRPRLGGSASLGFAGADGEVGIAGRFRGWTHGSHAVGRVHGAYRLLELLPRESPHSLPGQRQLLRLLLHGLLLSYEELSLPRALPQQPQ